MWWYVRGTLVKPRNTDDGYAALIDLWEANNANIITWINNSVEHSVGTHLAKYEISKKFWNHLEMLFTQSKFAK